MSASHPFPYSPVLSFSLSVSVFPTLTYPYTDRLENEQIGNTDQYRATREVPLPYSSINQHEYADEDDSDLGDNGENGESDTGVASNT